MVLAVGSFLAVPALLLGILQFALETNEPAWRAESWLLVSHVPCASLRCVLQGSLRYPEQVWELKAGSEQ